MKAIYFRSRKCFKLIVLLYIEKISYLEYMFTSLQTICFDNFTAPFDPYAINQNFGSGGFGGDGFGGGGFGVSASASHSNFDPNALNHGFGGGGFGN